MKNSGTAVWWATTVASLLFDDPVKEPSVCSSEKRPRLILRKFDFQPSGTVVVLDGMWGSSCSSVKSLELLYGLPARGLGFDCANWLRGDSEIRGSSIGGSAKNLLFLLLFRAMLLERDEVL